MKCIGNEFFHDKKWQKTALILGDQTLFPSRLGDS